MIFKKKISLIIPCKNEEAGLYSLLQKVPSYIDEVLVVDNGSTDRTFQVAQAGGAVALKEKKNIGGIGYGFSHIKGMKKATGDYLVAMDGDDTYPVNKIEEIIIYMEKNHLDFVSCSRLPLRETEAISGLRQLGIQLLNYWAKLLYGYHFLDILSGMWVVRKEALPKLKLTSGGWDFSPEIKLAALYNKEVKFSEYHIPYMVRINGRSKLNAFKTGFNHLVFILKRRVFIDRPALKPFVLKPISLAKYLSTLILT